ncbi:MAG: dihydrodipicolinate synthase family protein [Chloroflexi bacterium]|nr:dihydrodipicolinate synthase family protein [Chloroflexota bacterium]
MPPFVELAVAAHGPQKNSGAGSTEQRVVMGRRGTQRFRHRFRRTLQSFKFQAIGGDDPGTRWVHVEILSPPTALDLRVAIEPPAYTGLPLIKRMVELAAAGDMAAAQAEHERLLPLFTGLFVITSPIPVKYCLNRAGFDAGGLRLPLVEADPKTAAFLDELLAGYEIDLPTSVTA